MWLAKLKNAPKAFAGAVKKINQLIDASNSVAHLHGLEVQSPLEIVAAEQNSKLTINIEQLTKGIALEPGGTGGGSSGGGVVFNNELHYDDGSVAIDIDGSGIVYDDGTTKTEIDPDGITLFAGVEGTARIAADTGGVSLYNPTAAKTLYIELAAITQNMSVITVAVCNSGTPSYIYTIGSSPIAI